MARGWESKAIESQQADAAGRGQVRRGGPAPDPVRESRRRELLLARARMTDDLSRAGAAAHREMLQRAISALDERLAALGADRD